MLVVIGIIAVLAALAFPVYGKTLASQQNAGCLSNLRQIGMATLSYCNDNDGYIPGPNPSDPKASVLYKGVNSTFLDTSSNLTRFIAPYLGEDLPVESPKYMKVLECPTHTAKYGLWTVSGGNPSYQIHMFTNKYPWGSYPGSSPAQPSLKLFQISVKTGLSLSTLPIVRDFDTSSARLTAHITYMNAVFWDGHVGRIDASMTTISGSSSYLPKF